MVFKEIRVKEIPCLSFLKGTDYNLYIGPRLSWYQRTKIRKHSWMYNIFYLPDYLKNLSKKKLSYNFPGVTFPKKFSADIIYQSIRESLGNQISPKSRFFIRYNGEEFVALLGTSDLDYAIGYLLLKGHDFNKNEEESIYPKDSQIVNRYLAPETPAEEVESEEEVEEEVRFCIRPPKDFDKAEFNSIDPITPSAPLPSALQSKLKSDLNKTAEDVKKGIEALLLSGFSKEIIKSWLQEEVKLSRLRITKQFKILLVDYNKEVKMGPLPKTVFLFFLRHPEGVRFSYLQDHVKELMSIYGKLSVNDDPQKMKASIEALTDPFNNSINEKCAAIKKAFLMKIDDDIAQNYYVTGMQGGIKGITLDADLVEWECELDK